MIIKTKRNIYKLVSLVTLSSFLLTNAAWGMPDSGLSLMPKMETPSFLQVEIPSNLASVEEVYQAPAKENPKLVLNIQDIHGNYESQVQISKLLQYLYEKFGFKLFFAEGAAEKLNMDLVRFFPDAERNHKIAEIMAKNGEMTGIEYFLMDGPKDAEAVGIEKAELYRQNFDAFKKVYGAHAEVESFFELFEGRLETMSSRVFSPNTRRILAEWRKFESGHRDFLPYVKRLASDAKTVLNLDLESLFAQVEWPQITRLLALQSMEVDLDRKAAESDRVRLIAFLNEQKISPKMVHAIETLDEKKISMSRSEAEARKEDLPRYLFERLVDEAGPKGFQFHDYPAFSLWAGHLILQNELDSKLLFEEIEKVFTKILSELTVSEREKNLMELTRDEILLKKLLHLEVTRKEWERSVYRKDWMVLSAMVGRLKKINDEMNGDLKLNVGDWSQLEKMAGSALSGKPGTLSEVQATSYEFYDFAHQRESVFFKTINDTMNEKGIDKAVVVTGGFHTDGLMEMFRENEFNASILMPRISGDLDNSAYVSTMMENKPSMFDIGTMQIRNLAQQLRTLEVMGADEKAVIARFIETVMQVGVSREEAEAIVAEALGIGISTRNIAGKKPTIEIVRALPQPYQQDVATGSQRSRVGDGGAIGGRLTPRNVFIPPAGARRSESRLDTYKSSNPKINVPAVMRYVTDDGKVLIARLSLDSDPELQSENLDQPNNFRRRQAFYEVFQLGSTDRLAVVKVDISSLVEAAPKASRINTIDSASTIKRTVKTGSEQLLDSFLVKMDEIYHFRSQTAGAPKQVTFSPLLDKASDLSYPRIRHGSIEIVSGFNVPATFKIEPTDEDVAPYPLSLDQKDPNLKAELQKLGVKPAVLTYFVFNNALNSNIARYSLTFSGDGRITSFSGPNAETLHKYPRLAGVNTFFEEIQTSALPFTADHPVFVRRFEIRSLDEMKKVASQLGLFLSQDEIARIDSVDDLGSLLRTKLTEALTAVDKDGVISRINSVFTSLGLTNAVIGQFIGDLKQKDVQAIKSAFIETVIRLVQNSDLGENVTGSRSIPLEISADETGIKIRLPNNAILFLNERVIQLNSNNLEADQLRGALESAAKKLTGSDLSTLDTFLDNRAGFNPNFLTNLEAVLSALKPRAEFRQNFSTSVTPGAEQRLTIKVADRAVNIVFPDGKTLIINDSGILAAGALLPRAELIASLQRSAQSLKPADHKMLSNLRDQVNPKLRDNLGVVLSALNPLNGIPQRILIPGQNVDASPVEFQAQDGLPEVAFRLGLQIAGLKDDELSLSSPALIVAVKAGGIVGTRADLSELAAALSSASNSRTSQGFDLNDLKGTLLAPNTQELKALVVVDINFDDAILNQTVESLAYMLIPFSKAQMTVVFVDSKMTTGQKADMQAVNAIVTKVLGQDGFKRLRIHRVVRAEARRVIDKVKAGLKVIGNPNYRESYVAHDSESLMRYSDTTAAEEPIGLLVDKGEVANIVRKMLSGVGIVTLAEAAKILAVPNLYQGRKYGVNLINNETLLNNVFKALNVALTALRRIMSAA